MANFEVNLKTLSHESTSAPQHLSTSAPQHLSTSAPQHLSTSAFKTKLAKHLSFNLTLICFLCFAGISSVFGQSCGTPTVSQIIPELHPKRTVRVAFHIIHQNNISDHTNVPNDSAGNSWWDVRIPQINALLENPVAPNYTHWGRKANDANIRIEKYGVYHYVDADYYDGKSDATGLQYWAPDMYNHFVGNSNSFTTFEKENILHCFYYGGNSFGGAASGIPSKQSIRFQGRYAEYDCYMDNPCNKGNLLNEKVNDNFIHELGHNLGLSHNQVNSTEASDDTTNCDYELCNCSFDFANGQAPNNFMAKGPGQSLYRSFTYCQLRKMVYYSNGYNTPAQGSDTAVVEITKSTTNPCLNDNIVTLTHINPQTGDFTYVLDYPLTVHGDIILDPRITLVVKCTLQMPPWTKIYVMPGAKLIVDGGKITNNPSCGSWWSGIEVWGNPKKSQFEVDGLGYLYQGVVELKNGAVIENAWNAVNLWKPGHYGSVGGFVVAKDATIRNCKGGISFMSYKNYYPAIGKVLPNRSRIEDCTFEWTNNWIDFYVKPAFGISAWGVDGVQIINSEFINKDPGSFSTFSWRGTGIYSEDAGYKVKSCEFTNLWKGVSSGLVSIHAQKLEENTFTNCKMGIESVGQHLAVIQKNTFDACGTATVLDNSKAFKTTDNLYKNGYSGIHTINLRGYSNQIYNNDFENQSYAIVTTASTTSSSQGLSYKCNTLEPSTVSHGLQVIKGVVDKSQGACRPTDQGAETFPAGNEFSLAGGSLSDFDVWIGYPGKIEYNHHYQPGTGYFKPVDYTSLEIDLVQCQTSYNTASSCPTQYVSQGSVYDFNDKIQVAVSNYFQEKDEFNTKKNYFESNELDGGSTSNRLNFINNSLNSSSQIKSELDQFKPYLSDEVIWACINRDPELDDIDLYKILLDNSPLSIPLANYIPQLNNILTSTQINDLISIQGGLSARDDKEHEIRWHEQQAELALSDILRLFLYDTVPPNPIDSMIYYLEDWNSEESQEMLIGLYWQKENYTAAQSLINSISSNETNSELAPLYQKIHDIYSSDDSLPSLIADTLFLDSIAIDSTHGGQAMAKQLMWFLVGKEYPRYFQYLPESGSRSDYQTIQTTVREELANEKIKIYPNPSTGKFTMDIEMEQETLKNLSYEIILLNGSKVYHSPIPISSHHTLVELPTQIHGTCYLIIKDGTNPIFVKQLNIH